MTPTFNSREEGDVQECVDHERARWRIDLATYPEDDDGLSEDDRYLTWVVRRYKRQWREVKPGWRPDPTNQDWSSFSKVQEHWDELRQREYWKLEKPMIATAKYYVKRVVL